MRWPAAPLVLAAATSFAQTRPLLTEEAATARAGSLVLEAGAEMVSGEPNYLTSKRRDRWDAPVLRLVYSPADRVEIDLEWVGRVIARGDPDFGNVSDFGDVTLRAKVRFLEGAGGGPGLAARFAVTLPETSFGNGLGPNTLRTSAQMLFSTSAGPLAFHANAGLAIQDEPLRAHEQRDFLAYGVAVGRAMGRAAVVAEVAGLAGRGAPGADARSEARLGFRYGKGRIGCDAALRRGLSRAVGRWGFSAGLSWRISSGTGPAGSRSARAAPDRRSGAPASVAATRSLARGT
jgi:hypothetical protein